MMERYVRTSRFEGLSQRDRPTLFGITVQLGDNGRLDEGARATRMVGSGKWKSRLLDDGA